MKGLTNSTYELTENSDEEVVWGADNGLSTVDFLQFNEDGTFAGALPLSDEKWDQLMDQLTLEEAANFIEKAGDKNFEKLDSIFLPEAIWYDGPVTATTRLQDMQPAGMNPTLPSRLMFLQTTNMLPTL